MKFLFDFSGIIYYLYVLGCVMLCCDTNRVATMNELLSYSGWVKMPGLGYPIRTTDRRQTDKPEIEITMKNFLEITVIEENVVDKIQVAHQFLSCLYSRLLMDVSDYERGIGSHCKNLNTTLESFECLEVIRYKNPMVMRMTGALSSLKALAPNHTQFEEALFEILINLPKYYPQKTVDRPPKDVEQATRQTIDAECNAVEQHAIRTFRQFFAFYNRLCRPIAYFYRKHGYSEVTKAIMEFEKRWSNSDDVVSDIKKNLKKILEKFTKSHDDTSGFEYDPVSHTTRIQTYDSNITVRVEKTKQLLEVHNFWTNFQWIQIKERDSPYRTKIDDLIPTEHPYRPVIITKENVYAKLKLAHNFLSCKYASILRECCEYVTSMWTNCQESRDSVCLDKFLTILNETDLSVKLLRDALSFFHRLSPDTVFNRGVYDLLENFKRFYDDRNARDNRDVMSWSPDIENDISKIANDSHEFYQQFCYSTGQFYDEYISDDLKGHTIDAKGKMFKKRVLDLTSSHAVLRYNKIRNVFQSL